MEHLKSELDSLRSELRQMFALVLNQLQKSEDVILENKTSLVKEIASTEKLVNAKELQIDSRCETILALFTPVAVDLRFVLSALKINTNLERIADIADTISRTVVHSKVSFDKALLKKIDAKRSLDAVLEMLQLLINSFEVEDTLLAREVFTIDKIIDLITYNSVGIVEEYAKESPDNLAQAIPLLMIMKMFERAGDHLKNIAEEIIFYSEAKVLKHSGKTIPK
ncbi:MAG: phosphate signaling complex protein PhoU [Bacteroidia bacterium]